MTRSSPNPSKESLPVRWGRRLLAALASLQLAVVLLAVLIPVLAWATIVESVYGAPAAAFGFYGSWWFLALSALLGLNVLAAVVVRFPWRRHQLGFLLTHLGILVLMAGALVGNFRGARMQLRVFEGTATRRAEQDTQHFTLEIRPTRAGGRDVSGELAERIDVPFCPGPFNWDDYAKLPWFPWRLAQRSRGLVFDRDGVTLEVLDYYSDSQLVAVPRVAVRVDSGSRPASGRSGTAEPTPMTLSVVADSSPHAAGRPFGLGEQQATPEGDRVVFWMTGSRAETAAFLDGLPEGPLGDLGQVALCHDGQTFRFQVDQWQKQPRQPLGDTGLEVELVQVNSIMLGVQIDVFHGDDPPQPMTLLATLPYMNRQDVLHGVFGAYWLDPQTAALAESGRSELGQELLRQAERARIDVIQDPDGRLAYRTWRAPQIGEAAFWPTATPDAAAAPGSKIVAFRQSDRSIALTLDEHVARREPGWEVRPMPFERPDRMTRLPQSRARLRLTVDGHAEEFWLAAATDPALPDQRLGVVSGNCEVTISLAHDAVDLGFEVFLHEFQRKLDPGANDVSHFSSRVDFLPADGQGKPLQENVLISLNAPVDFRDPRDGRSYRLYQSSYAGPLRPGDRQFDEMVGGTSPRDRLFQSVLAVNSDPGRGLKYLGCLLGCVGILVTFYLRRPAV